MMKDRTGKYLELLDIFRHEIRAPLGGIIGFSQLLGLEENELSADQKEWVGNINQASDRLLSAFNDLLSSASYMLRPITVQFELVAPAELILSVERMLNNQYWMTIGQSFRFLIESDSDLVTIEADRYLLEDMLLWFFGNNSRICCDFDQTNVYFIHIGTKPGFIEINISNVTGGEKSKIYESESAWMELILEIVKAHSGQFAFKKDDNDKTFAAITLPIDQGK